MWLLDILKALGTFALDIIAFIEKGGYSEVAEPVREPTPPPVPVSPKYLWDNPADVRHSVRVICDEEGLTVQQKNELCATIHCESQGFKTKLSHPNIVNGHTSSTDWGLVQVNDYWHIGPGKDFPSVEYVLDNPEACVRWMCKLWKSGEQGKRLWVCYSKNLYQQYL